VTRSFRAGAASLAIVPPLGLPMIGFFRQPSGGTGYGWPLELTALVLDDGVTRTVLCGVDAAVITAPEIDVLRTRIAEATGASLAGVLVNTQHTHLSPIACAGNRHLVGDLDEDTERQAATYIAGLADKIVSVCRLAVDRLEPASIAWALAEVDEAVNRRERTSDGRTVLGWNPDNLVDRQLGAMQARRPDGSAICTLVSYGCHPVTTGYDMSIYSADYPGPLRALVRQVSGGECVFFQASAGNVVPKVSFTNDEREAERLGRRLALEALRALEGRSAVPRDVVTKPEASMVPIIAYRVRELPGDAPALEIAERRVRVEFSDVAPLAEVVAQRACYDEALQRARAAGDVGAVRVAMVGAHWGKITEEAIRSGSLETHVELPMNAVRIGDGLLVTAPGETFTEIGMAVKQRSPGTPTIFCGYTNGMVGYIPTTDEYRFGGHEPVLGNRAAGTPAVVAPGTDTVLVRAGIRLAEELFPGCDPWPEERGWNASPELPTLAPSELQHPGVAHRGNEAPGVVHAPPGRFPAPR
jgi:neutral ceramidase